jgi:quercetin dioxygenase-like cupin family protein
MPKHEATTSRAVHDLMQETSDMATSLTSKVVTAAAVEALPVAPLGDLPGIGNRVLWQDGSSIAGVLDVAAGHRLGAHTHRVNHHHLWVIDGAAQILGEEVGPGSYVHVPSGVEHDIDATGTGGCRVFYLYLNQAT